MVRSQCQILIAAQHLRACLLLRVQAAGDGVGSVALKGSEAAEEDAALGMNKSQVAGVVTALRHRVSLLQGPPGTGKFGTRPSVLKGFAGGLHLACNSPRLPCLAHCLQLLLILGPVPFSSVQLHWSWN